MAKKIGELLIEAGLIDDFQLNAALAHQRNWGGKLGSVLVEMEFVKEQDVAKAIAEKLRTPYANLFEPEIPLEVLKFIKEDVAKKYGVVPVKKEAGGLVVAMSDPLDIEVIDALRFATGQKIKPALALESEIRDAIKKYYDHQDIVHRPRTLLREIASHSSEKMEIIHGSDLTMKKTDDASSPIIPKDEAVERALQDYKIRMDALISLLIEKGLITREELVSMIYQKKIGL